MPPADFWEDDEWDHHRRVQVSGARYVEPPRRPRLDDYGRHSDREFLVPETSSFSAGLHRTRSQGHAPAPNVTIYNTTRLDNESNPNVRTEQRSQNPSPLPSPRGRPRRIADDWALEEELNGLKLEVALQKRERSRSTHHHHHDESPHRYHAHPQNEYDKWQLQMANERLKDAEDKLNLEKRDELMKKRMELKYLKDKQERDEEDARMKVEEDRIRKNMELKYMKDRRERDDEEARFKAEEERLKKVMELKYYKERRDRDEEEAKLKAEEDRLKKEWELKQERKEREAEYKAREAEAERKRIIAENNAKIAKEKKEADEERQRAVDEFEKKRAAEEKRIKDEKDRIVADYERQKVIDAEKAKKARDELLYQIKIEQQKEKEKEDEEWARFLRKQKDKEEEEKAKKKKAQQEVDEQMRQRLAKIGFQDNQIQAMINPEEAARIQQTYQVQQGLQHQHHHVHQPLQQGLTPLNPLRLTHQPTYVKVHKDHLAVDTLLYYDVPYEVDRADPDFIIILREMEPKETEILFEHTRRLRTRTDSHRLLIEERHDHGRNDYAWVRRRKHSVSPSRRRSSPKRVVGIKEMFY